MNIEIEVRLVRPSSSLANHKPKQKSNFKAFLKNLNENIHLLIYDQKNT